MKTIDSVIASCRQDPSLAQIYTSHLTSFASTHDQAVRMSTHPETVRIAERLYQDCLYLAQNNPPQGMSQRLQAFLAACRTLDLPRDERNRLCLADDEARGVVAA